MKKADSSIAGLIPTNTLLGHAFEGLGNIVSGLASGALRVLEFTLGGLLKDAIESVISAIRNMISETITAGSEFQTLEIRLKNLNFNTAIESGMEYNDAMAEATKLTKEQLTWVQKLAVQSPYNATDIANVFTLARSYSFSADKAKGLTEDITKFAAGMGLGNEEIERIIVNFGQMSQQANVNQRDLNDLARGSFVPINDILDIMRKKTGLTGDAFDAFTHSAEGVTAFTDAFSTLVEQRFSKSSEAMARTFQGATDNVKDFVNSLIGLNVVKPIMDILGGALADFTNALSSGDRWDKFVATAQNIGQSLSGIIQTLIGGLPSAESFADTVLSGFQGIADWLRSNQQNIVDFFVGIGDTIREKIIPFITDSLIPAFNDISGWVTENGPTIKEFFSTLGEIVSEVFSAITNQKGKPASGGGILESITSFMQFVIDNKDAIVKWIEILWSVFVIWQLLSTAFNVIVGVIVSVTTVLLGLVTGWAALVAVIPTILIITGVIGTIVAVIYVLVSAFNFWRDVFLAVIATITAGAKLWYQNVVNTIANVKAAFLNGDWIGVGRAIINGIIYGISAMVATLAATAANAAYAAYTAAKRALGIRSPSTLFTDIGEKSIQGMIEGVNNMVGAAASNMGSAMKSIAMPAMMASQASSSYVSSTNYNNTNNFNASFVSNTPKESLVQDFGLLQSLVGAS